MLPPLLDMYPEENTKELLPPNTNAACDPHLGMGTYCVGTLQAFDSIEREKGTEGEAIQSEAEMNGWMDGWMDGLIDWIYLTY